MFPKIMAFALSLAVAAATGGPVRAANSFDDGQLRHLFEDSEFTAVSSLLCLSMAGNSRGVALVEIHFKGDGKAPYELACEESSSFAQETGEGSWRIANGRLCIEDTGPRFDDKLPTDEKCWPVRRGRFGPEAIASNGSTVWRFSLESHPKYSSKEELLTAVENARAQSVAAAPAVQPAGPTVAERAAAQQAVAKLQAELAAWNAVKGSQDTGALQTFMETHPASQFAALAGLKIQQLTAQAAARQQGELLEWQALQNSSDINALWAYVEKYPNGSFSGFAKARIAALEAPPPAPVPATAPVAAPAVSKEEVELAAWERARRSMRVSDVQAYLDEYPQGRFAAEAQSRLEVVKQLAAIEGIEFGSYHALIIGIDDYKHLPKLNTAVSDARAVSDVLKREYGFKVTLLENSDRFAIIDALDELRETLGSNDNLLVYYAGHGWLDDESDRGYWLPVNAKNNRRSRWVSNATVTDTLKSLAAKQVMVVADSCYSGTLTRSATAGLKSGDYWKRIAKKRARVALVSGGLEPVADAGVIDTGHSPFAKAFIEALESNRVVMDGNQLFTSIRRPVMVNAQQTPEYSDVRNAGHDGGDFLFVRKR